MHQRRDFGSEVGCWGVSVPSLAMQRRFVSERSREGKAEPDHWSERWRATSVSNSDVTGRPRRSVLSFGGNMKTSFIMFLLA